MPPTNGVAVTLKDGKERKLRYDWEALEQAEQVLGAAGVLDLAARLDLWNMRAISTLVWLGMRHAEPDLTHQQVVGLLDSRQLNALVVAVTEAMTLAMPEKAKTKGGDGEGGADGGNVGAAT